MRKRDLHISHSLPEKFEAKFEAQRSFHQARRLERGVGPSTIFAFTIPSFPKNHNSRIVMSIPQPSPWPQEPLKKNRWRSISSTNGIARNHLRRQPNLEAPVGRRDPRSFPPSRMGVLETPIHPCYIDLHPCAVSGVESTNDTVVTFV